MRKGEKTACGIHCTGDSAHALYSLVPRPHPLARKVGSGDETNALQHYPDNFWVIVYFSKTSVNSHRKLVLYS